MLRITVTDEEDTLPTESPCSTRLFRYFSEKSTLLVIRSPHPPQAVPTDFGKAECLPRMGKAYCIRNFVQKSLENIGFLPHCTFICDGRRLTVARTSTNAVRPDFGEAECLLRLGALIGSRAYSANQNLNYTKHPYAEVGV